MKRVLFFVVALGHSIPFLHAGRDSVAGGLFGGLAGGMIAGALTNAAHKSNHTADYEVVMARQQAERLQHEQAQQQIEQLRRDLERKEQLQRDKELQTSLHSQQQPLFYLLILFLVILLIGLGLMSVLLLRKKSFTHDKNESR